MDSSGFGDVTTPILAVRATDDPWATEVSHRDIHARFTAAPVTYRDIAPDELAVERIGHIDLLRATVGGGAWPELVDWLLQR